MFNGRTAVSDEERIQVGPRLPKSLVNRLKAIAKRDGKTLTRVLEEALTGYVEGKEKGLPSDLVAQIEDYLARKERKR